MPRGQPDWGMYSVTTYLAGMSDMAELAARLESPVLFDRRGKVAHIDDFEGALLKWRVNTANGGSAILDGTEPKSGRQCVRLGVDNQANSGVNIVKGFVPLTSDRLGIEISFARPDTDYVFYFYFDHDTGTELLFGGIKIDFDDGELEYYYTTTLSTVFATGLDITTETFCHHPIKLVVDFEAKKYVRFMYAGVEYDLSAYDLYSLTRSQPPALTAVCGISPKVQDVSYLYLDDFILTQEEP